MEIKTEDWMVSFTEEMSQNTKDEINKVKDKITLIDFKDGAFVNLSNYTKTLLMIPWRYVNYVKRLNLKNIENKK